MSLLFIIRSNNDVAHFVKTFRSGNFDTKRTELTDLADKFNEIKPGVVKYLYEPDFIAIGHSRYQWRITDSSYIIDITKSVNMDSDIFYFWTAGIEYKEYENLTR